VRCIEIDPRRHEDLMRAGFHYKPILGDFIREPIGTVDAVVMNPPFARQQDLEHVSRAMHWLRPGGRLVSIMSASITFRQNKLAVEFRKMVATHNGTITPLPDDTFAEAGTRVRTVLLSLKKLS
jgi:predicted RNA methylase